MLAALTMPSALLVLGGAVVGASAVVLWRQVDAWLFRREMRRAYDQARRRR